MAALFAAAMTVQAAPARASAGVTVEGTSFHVTESGGTVLDQASLPGTILTLGDGGDAHRRIRIDAVERDARDAGGELVLYTLSEQDPATGAWVNACMPDPDGRRLGFPLAGAFTPDGVYQPRHNGILITCTGGAEGKCVRFGYQPWHPDLLPYYQACVRLVRADYGGDGIGHTRNGMPIDLFDRIGIQADEPAHGMTLEAAFGTDGAVCVAHTRLPDTTLEELRHHYPRLAGHVGSACDDHAPALLFVRSFPP